MKKGIILLATTLLISAMPILPSMAQSKLVKQVERMVKKDNSNLDEARKLLAPALEHPETKEDAHAWYVRGLIEETAVERGYIGLQMGQDVDEKKFYEAVDNMVKYYRIADEFDAKPDKRGRVRKKYDDKIKSALQTYYQFLINGGSMAMEAGDFEKAHHYFKSFGDVKRMDLFQGTPVAEVDSMSMQIDFFSAYTASQIEGNLDNAIAEYERIKTAPYRQDDVYQLLAQSYIMKEDTVNFLKTLQEGIELFPEQEYYLFNMINIYIQQGKHDEAKDYLNAAIAKSPNNEQLYYVLATVYEQGYQDSENAEANFRKALEINPKYGDAVIGLGRIYYNQAVVMQSEANALNDPKEYDKLNTQAKELFNKALPYFEKAVEIDPENTQYLMALRGIYYNLGMEDKMAELEQKMGL